MSSRDQRGNKKDGSRQASKKAGSVTQGGSDDTMPPNFGFLWSIDPLRPDYERKPEDILGVGTDKGNNIAKLWFPPTHLNRFRHRRGGLWRWSMGVSELVDMKRPNKVYDIASVFFQPRTDNFIITRLNCTTEDVERQSAGWGYVSFRHLDGNLSRVDFAGTEFALAAPANNSTWMPQVLPRVYDHDAGVPGSGKGPGESGGLCGKLAILFGMAAFSAEETYAEEIVAKSFKLHYWKHHERDIGIGRYKHRGVIVSIYLDPSAVGVTKEHLKKFENGTYGPIWDYEPLPPTDTRSAYTTASSTTSRLNNSARSIPRNPMSYTYSAQPTTPSSTLPYTYATPPTFQQAPTRIDSPRPALDDNEGEDDIYDPPN